MDSKLHFSSASNEWSTPQDFFEELDQEFHFTLDPCATKENAKCEKFYTVEDNGLEQCWGGETVFMNPPYGRGIKNWIECAWVESELCGATVVGLIPARTDTAYWHEFIFPHAEIRFIKGRLKFGGNKNPAPFPSAVVIWRGKE